MVCRRHGPQEGSRAVDRPEGFEGRYEEVDDYTIDVFTKGPNPVLMRQLTELRMMDKEWSEKNKSVEPKDIKTKDENFAWFKVVSTHQVAHLEFGSFAFEFYRPSAQFDDLRSTLAAPLEYHDHARSLRGQKGAHRAGPDGSDGPRKEREDGVKAKQKRRGRPPGSTPARRTGRAPAVRVGRAGSRRRSPR